MFGCNKFLVWTALFGGLVSGANAQFTQQGPKLVGTGGIGFAGQGFSVALSADGNTALVGGAHDNLHGNNYAGAAWVFTRTGGVWSQEGAKLVPSDGDANSYFGWSVALSADGNTALVGGIGDSSNVGAAWVFTRSGGVWSQQGAKLAGSGGSAPTLQGYSVALSADGNTAVLGGPQDNLYTGAAWVFTRVGGVWSQQGAKFAGSGLGEQGISVALSAGGDTALLGGALSNGVGGALVFTRSGGTWGQQGGRLAGSDAIPSGFGLNVPVALSADGNTALLGWPGDHNFLGAAWVFTRSGGTWSQQGGKLVGSGSVVNVFGGVYQGAAAALSADGNTAIVGGYGDTLNLGASWMFRRAGSSWSPLGTKLLGSGAIRQPSGEVFQGYSVAMSGDGYTALVGGYVDNSVGATWVFTAPKPSTTALASSADPSLYGQSVAFTATVTAGATGTVTFTVDGVSHSTVPLNGSEAQFSITNLGLGSHTISAAYGGDATFAPSTSNQATQTVNPLGVISLFANTVVSLGKSAQLPVTLAKAAPPAGLTIYLTSSDPAKVTVTPSVFVPGGRMFPNLPPVVNGLNLGIANITATALGYTSATQSVRVTAAIAFARCCVTIFGTATQNVSLTLSGPAPAGGLTVPLLSDDPLVAKVPATVTFPANATSVNVPITAVAAGITAIHAGALPNLLETTVNVTVR